MSSTSAVTPSTVAKTTFSSLSSEIKAHIVEKIPRPSDLKKVCLISKELHAIAVKPLYHSVSLDLGSSSDNCLTAFMNPRNIGLKYIRNIRLYLAGSLEKYNQVQQATLVTRMLIEFLPEDILEEFSWCPWKPFSADNLMLLYKKQRKMKWLEVMDLDRDVLPELKKDEKLQNQLFKHPTQLSIYPENRETLRLSGFYAQKMNDTLEDLVVHTEFLSSMDQIIDPLRNYEYVEARELHDSANAPGLLTSTVFSHMLPFDKCQPFQRLKKLRLDRINLRHCEDTWCKIVQFTEIEALRIHTCPGADTLLSQLSKAANLPKKLKTFHFQHKDNIESDALLALDGFLCLTSGITDLVIELGDVAAMPAAAGITRHGKTLEKLNVHCSTICSTNPIGHLDFTGDELVWSNDAFAKICEDCTKLQQFSCAWPTTSLIREPTDEWQHFEDSIADLPHLVTMIITNFPNNKPSSQLLPKVIYEQLLQGLAQRVFQQVFQAYEDDEEERKAVEALQVERPKTERPANLRPKLRIIAFGISNKIYEREDSKHQLIYLRSTCQDADGKAQIYAAPISWCLTQYVEGNSDILQFILNRRARTPWREGITSTGLGWSPDDDD